MIKLVGLVFAQQSRDAMVATPPSCFRHLEVNLKGGGERVVKLSKWTRGLATLISLLGLSAGIPVVWSQQGESVVVSEGVSCRQQIEHGTGRRARHLVEVLAGAL